MTPLAVDWFGDWSLTGSFTTIDLIAATIGALNGALLARRPSHYRNFTIVGVLLMACSGVSLAASPATCSSTRSPPP
jgi:hypothetical protein